MAPSLSKYSKQAETHHVVDTGAPLADYFFIAGIESSQIHDGKLASLGPPAPVEDTIEEDAALVTRSGNRPGTPGSLTDSAGNRLSRYSFDARKSIGSMITAHEPMSPPSNRSSVTIKPAKDTSTGMSDDAFEEALKKFASERDSFLEDIHASAGVVPTTAQKKARPKTVRITQEEATLANGLKGPAGSFQRRLSTMKSMRRQSSVVSRQASVRTSKRMSGYNSVIPAPQPFQSVPGMHPLKRRYEPCLLDRYPTKVMVEETKRRIPFPDYVPMFTFPNDVTVVSSDKRPRSTWHGFAMTSSDNSKMYGICVTIWVPLNQTASEALELQCEEWRRANMSNEERELASSLGERLSGERAKLSRLLSELPQMPSGSTERENLEEEIGAVEEKIGLMTDLLRPVRHGAASKIDGLTEGDTGLWIPRAYGVLGRDMTLLSFWKEWLKAVVVPMTNGGMLRVPASSPRVGLWQPLERYVVNLCVEALSPITSITQVEVGVRDLRLYARKEAINEIPGSRNTDLYALFRCLTVPNIIILFEYALAESRIILLSSHTSMLQLACGALTSLLYPLTWAGVLIPVLPSRLIQALEAPCPYIVGVERRYEKLELPDDDFCLVDLDENSIESTAPPISLPRPQRRKLQALLLAAASHHNRYGVPIGPPQYAIETFPNDSFSSESPQLFNPRPAPSTLASFVTESSANFGSAPRTNPSPAAIYNAFSQARADSARGSDRPSTSSTGTGGSSTRSPPSPMGQSTSQSIMPSTPTSRSDSGFALQASLREKRSGQLRDGPSRRNSAVRHLLNVRNPLTDRTNTCPQFGGLGALRRPSIPSITHHSTPSTASALSNGVTASTYAPSVYAQSTLAASTIMPHLLVQPVRDDEQSKWVEGHSLVRCDKQARSVCTICEERCDDEAFKCGGEICPWILSGATIANSLAACGLTVHYRCLGGVTLVCPVAFRPDQVRAAFVRCFASLFYTYRRFLHPASGERRKGGLIYHFHMDQFLKSVPHGDSEYMHMLRETQAFNEFVHDRERSRAEDPAIKLFDEIILAKRNRGRAPGLSFFSNKAAAAATSFLTDTSDHLWRSASATPTNARFPADTSVTIAMSGRIPAKLDPALMTEPRSIQGAPRLGQARGRRKPVASMLGLSSQSAES